MLHRPNTEQTAAPLPWFYLVDPLLQVTAVWCLFSFKIFFVSFGEAGMRPDDLLILLSLVGLCLTRRIGRTPISLPLRIYFVYVGIQLLSAMWNGMRGRVPTAYSLVFVVRVLEYTVFYFIGYSLARSGFRMFRVVLYYTYAVCAVVPLQMIGLLPVPGAFGRERVSANTNGPYEFAVVCGFLLCFVAYRSRRTLLGAVYLCMVVLTGSRITLVAMVLSLLHFGLTLTRSRGRTLAIASVLALVGLGMYVASSGGLLKIGAFDRIANSKSYELSDIRNVYDLAPVVQTSTEYYEGPFQDLNGLDTGTFEGDLSGLIRFTRWITLVKANRAHLDSILIGLGPSFGSAAVDGYFTRAYVETGILGLGAFLAFVASLLLTRRASSWYFREYVMIMAVSAVFIDIFLSYKCMLLLWLWHGMSQGKAPRRPPALPAVARVGMEQPVPARGLSTNDESGLPHAGRRAGQTGRRRGTDAHLHSQLWGRSSGKGYNF